MTAMPLPVLPEIRPVAAEQVCVELAGLPYVVFAGNVGDDRALADVVDRLEANR